MAKKITGKITDDEEMEEFMDSEEIGTMELQHRIACIFETGELGMTTIGRDHGYIADEIAKELRMRIRKDKTHAHYTMILHWIERLADNLKNAN